jgi:hypothetical protein
MHATVVPDWPPYPGRVEQHRIEEGRPLPGWLAVVLVSSTSAAVLVPEILAGRLMAPVRRGEPRDLHRSIANSVVLASDSALDPAAWGADGGELVADLDADLTGALVLTDDFAPVDQLILDAR